jgi:uncharacterized delta-60 repeat protein
MLGCCAWAQAQWGAVDTTFQPGGGNNGGLDGDVFAIAIQPDQKLLIGGAFTKISRTSRNRLARLRVDGSLDPDFDPGGGANGLVEVLVWTEGAQVLVGGRFSTMDGQARPYLARVNSTGGLDSAFAAEPNGFVLAAAAVPDGGYVIGGSFSAVNGVSRLGVARLDQHGALDLDFNPAVDRPVHSLAVAADGSIWMAGDFLSVNGFPRARVARLLTDGTVDSGFDPGTGASQVINALSLQADGKAVIGGAFTNFNGQSAWYLARLNPSGVLDETFTPSIAPVWGGVLALRTDGAGRVIVGGEFYKISSAQRAGIARLHSDGELDSTFDPGSGVANPGGFSPLVRSVALQADGRVVIGGRFTEVDGTKLNYIARLTGDMSGPLRFDSMEPLADGRLRLVVSTPVDAPCVLETSADFTEWTPVLTNQPSGGYCVFEILETVSKVCQFYRAVGP